MKKICITGPEATGKSTLSQTLAKVYDCPWVPEYARQYLSSLERSYTIEDLDEIVLGQCRSEEKFLKADSDVPYLFCDTGPEVLWVWSEYKYGSVSPLITSCTNAVNYDLTMLLDIDLPWEDDPLRETPALEERRALLEIYKDLLEYLGRPYHLIKGIGDERIRQAQDLLM